MAKPKKSVQISATIGDLCFYQRNGKTFLRKARSLDRELVLNDDRFEKTRNYANNMAVASKIASAIYKELPKDLKARWIYRSITGHAASLLYKGVDPEQVRQLLQDKYIDDPQSEIKEAEKSTYRTANYYRNENAGKMLKQLFLKGWEKKGKRMSDFDLAWNDPRGFNDDFTKRFNYPYKFLEERIKNLQFIVQLHAKGVGMSKAALNSYLSE